MAGQPPPTARKEFSQEGDECHRLAGGLVRDARPPSRNPQPADGPTNENKPGDGTDAGIANRAGTGLAGGRGANRAGDEATLTGRAVNGYRQSYAAIDLGTNNCRLLIARASGENLVVVDAFSRVVRLGEGLAQTGRLSDAAMDRAVSALRICADKLKRRNVHLARSVATEACRRAVNGSDFIERVRSETGIRLDIISAREEARLA